jgi:hypothetical protein
MSTPQWFAEFERQEAMREERLEQTRARVAEWRKSIGVPIRTCPVTHTVARTLVAPAIGAAERSITHDRHCRCRQARRPV